MAQSTYTYCFDFFASQNIALFCNLSIDLLSEYPFLPTRFERLGLIFLWMFDLIGYHAAETENLPSTWPEWVAPAGLLVGSLAFYSLGLVLIYKLPSGRHVLPLILWTISASTYFFNEWRGKTVAETTKLHGKDGVGVYTHLSFFLFQLSIHMLSRRSTTKEKKS